MYAFDVDTDGDIDIVVASTGDDEILWYQNDGSENFAENVISTVADAAVSVSAADIDRDGDIDIVSGSSNDSDIDWYQNNGSESFTSHRITNIANNVKSIFLADVDTDGRLDVLHADANNDAISWNRNDGITGFAARPTISSSADYATSVYAIDLDSDGDMDVLSSSKLDNKIAWYENNGLESFTTHNISTMINEASAVIAADINLDGNIDVVAASNFDDRISWFQNDGLQNFAARTVSQTVDGPEAIFVIDLDRDGDLDILSASQNDNKIAWHENGISILPVELSLFTAVQIENEIELFWKTETEVDNYGFEIQRTFVEMQHAASLRWEKVAFIQGHGNSNSPKSYSYTDKPTGGTSFTYRLKQIDVDGSFEYSKEIEVLIDKPTAFSLAQNYPNPFNPSTTIKFGLPKDSNVKLELFNILGEKIATLIDKEMQAGFHNYQLSILNFQLTSGVYIYKIEAGSFVSVKKLLLMK